MSDTSFIRDLTFYIANILGGIQLANELLRKYKNGKEIVDVITRHLFPLYFVTGGVLVFLGLYNLFKGDDILFDLFSILAGILLSMNMLLHFRFVKNNSGVLKAGQDYMRRTMSVQIIIGVIVTTAGVAGIIKML